MADDLIGLVGWAIRSGAPWDSAVMMALHVQRKRDEKMANRVSKADRAVICKCVNEGERQLREALYIYKSQPRAGVDLEGLKAIEAMVQAIEAWRASGATG